LTDIDELRVGRAKGMSVRVPLPIPLTPELAELRLYAQGAMFEHMGRRRLGVGVHASNGLEISVGR
jgi:hypothetical protein